MRPVENPSAKTDDSCRTVSRIYSGTGSGRQRADSKVNDRWAGNRRWVSRRGVGNGRAEEQIGSRELESRQTNRDSTSGERSGRRRVGNRKSVTGSQAGGSGDGDRGADRPTGTGRQAGGQTGEGSLIGRVE